MSEPLLPRQVLFVTGRLAEPALRRVLDAMAPPFAYDVAPLKITVAALMTTDWIARFLAVPPGTDLIVIPGLCEGDTRVLAERAGVPVRRGPKDLRELPAFFNRPVPDHYGAFDIAIVAEINNVPRMAPDAVRAEADRLVASGADIIDIGCTPGRAFPALGDRVRALRTAGIRVSIDSVDPDEIRRAVEAGAELVLSITPANVDVVDDLRGSGARVVIVPDLAGSSPDAAGLAAAFDPLIARVEAAGLAYLLDPILEPIGHGFMASLERYAATRRRYPDAGMLMGIGNLTELTAADSTGVNALLIAVCQELGIRTVLTTEVIPWARGSVREIDVARRLMHHAVSGRTLPKGVDDRLVTVKDPAVLTWSEAELRALQAQVTDPNLRIFADRDAITVFNHDRFVRGRDIQVIFDALGITDAGHAFYLGKELARAQLAMQLGKTYRQEGALAWGYLTPPDDPRREHVRLTSVPPAASPSGAAPGDAPGDA